MTSQTFAELGLDPLLLKALETEGYTAPTPIQAQAIPSVLAGKDLLGTAQTGTGKTAAFALPILQRLAANRQPAMRKGVRALILSPTRELATQIGDSFRTYGRHMGLTVAVVYGGVGHKPQRDALNRGVDILVATPGRLIDHMTERNVVLEGTEILVLDEADQMMDLGFIRPLRQIISKLSHRRQSLFFSATMPHEIGALAAELLKDPVRVSVAPVAKTADRVAQEVIFIEQTKKRPLLVELFSNPDMKRAIVFTRTKRGADKVAKYLEVAGIPVAAIHGNKSQGQRDHALGSFKAGKLRALIATDIAARGIDIDAVSHVINFEIPNIPESYVHRIGRTARAGAEGIAISLVDHEERAYLRDIERLTRQQIPSTDRRGDATLVAPAETRERAARHDGDRDERPHRGRGGENRGRGSDNRGRGSDNRQHGAEGRGDRKGPPRGDRHSRSETRHDAPGEGREDRRIQARSDGRPEGPRREHPRFDDRRSASRGDRPADDRSTEQRSARPPRRERPFDDRRPTGETGRDRPHHHRGGKPQGGDRREHTAEGHQARGTEVRHHADPTRERPPHGRDRSDSRSEGHRGGHGQGRGDHPRHHAGATEGRGHRGGEGRPRKDGESRGHGNRNGASGPGLDGVKFLSGRPDRARHERSGTRSGPGPNDRQKARPRPA